MDHAGLRYCIELDDIRTPLTPGALEASRRCEQFQLVVTFCSAGSYVESLLSSCD
jgi:hypothetical protein